MQSSASELLNWGQHENGSMKVSVIGSGYVGLVSGACLAELGNDVLCSDVDPIKIEMLQRGEVPIHEPGLQDIVTRNIAAGRLHFTTDLQASARFGRIQMIAVGTPSGPQGGADLQYVLEAARSIGQTMTDCEVVAVKSTVPVGTTDLVRAVVMRELAERGIATACHFVSNPEFLKQGAAVEDFMRPDRIVVGADNDRAVAAMQALYAPLQRHHKRFVLMDIKSAEMTKYAANAMLATRISLMNELANLAEILGADIDMVRLGIGADPRIGFGYLYAGCGYGGSCFPKDVAALIRTAHDDAAQLPLRVLTAVQATNDAQKLLLSDKVKRRFGSDLAGCHFALWGLAFKPNTDDMREAPSCTIIRELLDAGASVCAYDPKAMPEARRLFDGEMGLRFASDAIGALAGADALVIATEWKEFQSPDFDAIDTALKRSIIFDGRNLYDPAAMRQRGFEYHAIGR